MAQVTSKTPKKILAENVGVTVAESGNTTLLELDTRDVSEVGVEVSVTGQDLDAFLIQGKVHPNGTYQTLYSAAGDFTSPEGLLIGASGDLTVLAAAASGWLLLDTRPLWAVKILASSGNVAGSTVTARASGKG